VIQQVRDVEYGRAATIALGEAVAAAKAAGALSPVTVLVSSNFAGLAARRLLGSGITTSAGLANVGFLTPFRLAELLASDRLLDRRPLTNPVLGAAVRRALRDAPGRFRAVADHEATELALASVYSELSNVSPQGLLALSESAAESVDFFRRIRSRLGGFHDEADLMREAAAHPDLAAALAPFGHVIWYLPAPATAPVADFVGAVIAVAPSSVIVGLSGDADADAGVAATVDRAGVARSGDAAVAPPTASGIVTVTDPDEEVREVVRRIAGLAATGVPLDRIGVFAPVADPYTETLRQQFAAAGIPANGPARRRLGDSVAGRTLLAALELPSVRWRRDRVMALVSGAPVRREGGNASPALWEKLSRAAGVVHDLDEWQAKLDAHRTVLGSKLDEADPAGPSVGRLEREIDQIGQLESFVHGVAGAVGAVVSAPGWVERSRAAQAVLELLLGAATSHNSWPEAEQRDFDRVVDALARLATLDEVEPDPGLDVFVRALTAELDVTRGRSGRYGEGVLYGGLAQAVGQDLDAVFLLGCTEGLCPAPRRDDAMLPDDDRRRTGGELPLRSGRLHDQHRQFLAALASAPPDQRVLLFPRGSLRGGRQPMPSRWLLDSASALAGEPVYATRFDGPDWPGVSVVPSFADGVAAAGVHGSLADRDLAAIANHVRAGGAAAAHPAAAAVRRGLEAQAARRSERFTEWDGNLAGQPMAVSEEGMSPTRLQTWAECGFRYFLNRELELGPRDDPERVVEMSAMDRGSGVHAALERFLLEVFDEGVPGPDEAWTDTHRAHLAAVASEEFDRYEARGRMGRPIYAQLTKADMVALLDEFLTADDTYRREQRATPQRAEMSFGMNGAEPVTLTLPVGRRLTFRGQIDRVDRAANGTLLVTDYKTGKGAKYQALRPKNGAEPDPVLGGTTLQLGIYAEAARQHLGAEQVDARYWVLDRASKFPRYGYEWTSPRQERFLNVVTAIVDGIEAGAFPMVPGTVDAYRSTYSNCRYCDFAAICPTDRAAQADAKAGAPALQVRGALEMPNVEEAE